MPKIVMISEENYERIAQAGTFNETFDSVLSKVLDKVTA
jgi:hypothetical protein